MIATGLFATAFIQDDAIEFSGSENAQVGFAGVNLYGGSSPCSASSSFTTPTTFQSSLTMHPQQATVEFQTGAMTAPVPMPFQVKRKYFFSTFL
jgi:hypothetical protein